MRSILFTIFLVGTSWGFAIPKTADDASDAYVDQVLENVRKMIADNNLDPAPLPDGEVGFHEGIFSGSAKVYNGYFSGLATIGRTGDTSLDLSDDMSTLSLAAHIGISNAEAGYDARAEFMGIGIGASASARIRGVAVYFDAGTCISSGCTLQIGDFNIDDIGTITLDVNGLGPLDWILEILVDFVGNLIKGWLGDMLEGTIKDLIQDALNNIPPIPHKAELPNPVPVLRKDSPAKGHSGN